MRCNILLTGARPADNFLGIVREQHDLVAMFGEEYHHYPARIDNAPAQGNLTKLNPGEETEK
jgi:hypothetical protein